MSKSSSTRRIPIIVTLITVSGAIAVAILNTILPKLFNSTPTEAAVAVHVADRTGGASVPGAKVLLLLEGGAFAEYTDGNGVTSFKVSSPSQSGAHLFVESDRFEIYDEIIQLAGNQNLDIRLTPKGSNNRRVIVRVVDDSNSIPLDGAQVVVLVGSDSYSQSTDSNGIVKFTIAFPGDSIDADISVSTPNYQIERKRVTLRPDEVQDIRLDRDANELKVTAFEPSAPAQPSSSAPKSISFGQLLTDAISAPTEIHIYSFSANANDAIIIRIARTSGNFCPRIRLLGPDRKELSNLRTSPGCRSGEMRITLTENGDYKILIDDQSGTLTGEYNLNLQKIE